MPIQLTPAQEGVIHSKLQTGQYKSAEEVLEIALHLLNEYESGEADWLESIRGKIDEAYASTEPPVDGSTFINQLRQRFQPN
jgi:antitoxin ParD1/3/4